MRLAVIGDIHGFWDDRDTEYFNDSDYDGVLLVGDLPPLTNGIKVAKSIAGLTKPAWLIPGNHDGVTTLQLLAELKGWPRMRRWTSAGMERRVRRLDEALGPVRLSGYECLQLSDGLGLITARPHAMGPDKFYYGSYLQRRFGVASFEDSAARLRALVDQAPTDLIFMAHNGPSGLGQAADAPWGCDFSDAFGDFGDPDLRNAIDYARDSGRRVHAVVAGHMHHRSKAGNERRTSAYEIGTLFVNAACVPRQRRNGQWRHHVALKVQADTVEAQTVIVDEAGRITDMASISPA